MYPCPVCGALVETPRNIQDEDIVHCVECGARLRFVADADCRGDPPTMVDNSWLVKAEIA